MSRVSNFKLILILIATVLMAVIFPFLDFSPSIMIIIVALAYVALLSLVNEKLCFFLLLITRPTLDILSNNKILSTLGYSVNLSYVIGLFSILFALFIVLKNYKNLKNIPSLFSWFIFLILILASSLYSINIKLTIAEFVRLLSIISLFISGYLVIERKEDFINLIRVLIISTLIPLSFAFYQFATRTGMSIPLEGIYNRIYGTFAHPNLFAYYLLIPISLAFSWFLIKKFKDSFFIAFLPFMAVALALTFTRGAWAALILILSIIGIVRFKKLLIIGLLALITVYLVIAPIRSRVNDLLSYKNPYSSIQWRIDLWNDSMDFIKQNPLFGRGAGTAEEVILKNRGEEFGSPSPHNDFLKITLENGYIGLMAYLLVILSLLFGLLKRYFYVMDYEIKVYALFLIGIALAIYSLSFADNIIRNTALQWAFWALLGGYFSVTKTEQDFYK